VRGASEAGAAATLAKRLRFQARECGRLGSVLYEGLLCRAAEDLEAGGPAWEVLRGHEDDPATSALALRLMGAVNRLALEGGLPDLARHYGDGGADPAGAWRAFKAALEERPGAVRAGVERPVQTNEVGRCAAFLPGFLAVAASTGLPLRLLEIGASAGLNLRWDSYRYEADGFSWGSPDSSPRISFDLSGAGVMPAVAPVSISERRGCDASPLDAQTADGRLTLLSYIWPDQTVRVERMLAALELAKGLPVDVERAGAAAWVKARLSRATPGQATVVYHSIVMQYLSDEEREAFLSAVKEAGARASAEAPLAWLRMEPAGDRADVRLTMFPGAEESHLARVGYHGTPLELLDFPNP
jgi:hypothetical protein